MKGKIKGTLLLGGEHFQFRIYSLGKHRAQELAQMSCFSVQAELIAPSVLLRHFLYRSSRWNWFQDPQENTQIQDAQVPYIEQYSICI